MSHHNAIENESHYKVEKRTICRCHVELYMRIRDLDIPDKDKKRLIKVVKEAYGYGIKMNDKLMEYAGKSWKPEVFGWLR